MNKPIFNEEQVKSLSAYQQGNAFHPYTCCDHLPMAVTADGLVCTKCKRVQTQVLYWTLNWGWKK